MEMSEETREKQPPLLLTSHGQNHERQSFYSLLENRRQTTCILVLCSKRILASSYGWLVLVEPYGDDCCLWKPGWSMEIIQLPPLENPYLYNRCVLSKPPTEPDCYILFNRASTLVQAFCKIGDDEFSYHSLEEEDYELMAIGSFEGKFYGVVDPGFKFVNVGLVGKTLELRPMLTDGGQPWKLPQPQRDWVTLHDNYMFDSPHGVGELWLVTKMYMGDTGLSGGLEFRVFRVDIDGMKSVELESIGEQTIFISYCGNGFCCSSSSTKPNSIYYSDKKGGVVYIYDLVYRSTTPLQLHPSSVADPVNYWVDLHDILHQLII